MKVNERTGEYSLNLRERDDIKKAHQMLEGQRKHDVERGAENQAALKREKVVRRGGRVLDFPEEQVDTAKKNFRPAGRYGGAPSLRFGPISSLKPAWSYVCCDCGKQKGLWRQWSTPTAVVEECGWCGSKSLALDVDAEDLPEV